MHRNIFYLCLGCGMHFALGGDQKTRAACPRCGGDNLVKGTPSSLLQLLMGGAGGG